MRLVSYGSDIFGNCYDGNYRLISVLFLFCSCSTKNCLVIDCCCVAGQKQFCSVSVYLPAD